MKDKIRAIIVAIVALGLVALGQWIGVHLAEDAIYKSCSDYGSAPVGKGTISCFPVNRD